LSKKSGPKIKQIGEIMNEKPGFEIEEPIN
jgi:hypothetical protein